MDGYEERLRDFDSLNHILGNYIAIGVNNPKKYPKEPHMSAIENKERSMMTTDAELDAYICAKYNEGKLNAK